MNPPIDMTLRDYFAAKAMQTFLSIEGGSIAEDAKAAYRAADAMMKERDTPQAQPAPEIAIADAYRAGVDSGIAAEREACARVCESQPMRQDIDVGEQCAAAIRARGKT